VIDHEDRGGAVYVDFGSSPNFVGCQFAENESYGSGGAVYIDNNSSQPSATRAQFVSCELSNNTSSLRGGGIAVYEGTIFLQETSVHNNSARTGGGGIALDYMGSYVNVADSSSVTDDSSIEGESDIDDAADMVGLVPPVATE